jgi:hypothetical protein
MRRLTRLLFSVRLTRLLILGGVLFLGAAPAAAQSPPPTVRDWTWPLYEPDPLASGTAAPSSTPRPSVWASHGEFQEYVGTDLHPGIDVRGSQGDVVVFPQDGVIVHVSHREFCADVNAGTYCRLWVHTPDDHYIYYIGHFDFGHTPDHPITSDLRSKLVIAEDGTTLYQDANGVPNSGPPRTELAIPKGGFAGILVRYSDTNWAHVHLGVFDRQDRFASLDPLAFLNRNAVGNNGSALQIVDDERPAFKTFELRPDNALVQDSAVTSDACGSVVSGAIDIVADIEDTFFTNRPTPNTFEVDFLAPTIGIKGGRYVIHDLSGQVPDISRQWYESPGACQGTACGLWRLPFRTADRNMFVDDAAFFNWLDVAFTHGAPTYPGGDFADLLYDAGPSGNDHEDLDGAPAFHFLTHALNQNSSPAANSAWMTNATGMPDGRYVVTAEAWDDAGNLASHSTVVTVKNHGGVPSSVPGWAQVRVRDHDGDLGQIPSTLGGEPFWASPDILVVPEGTVVDETTFATTAPFVVDARYHVYVRAHNNGCADVSGVQAAVYIATPGPTFSNVRQISEPAEQYGGTPVIVPAGGAEVIGPFLWVPTAADLDGAAEGHRCFVAAINAPTIDPGPLAPLMPTTWNVPNLDNVAQRNVQVDDLSFFIRNVNPTAHTSEISIDMGTFPVGMPPASFELLIQETPELNQAWTYAKENGAFVIPVTTGMLTPPAWTIPAISQVAAAARFTLPDGSGPHRVNLTHKLDGVVVGGMTFFLSGPGIVK